MDKIFEIFEHGADVGIRGYGKTPEEALSNILKALASLLVEDLSFLEELPTHFIPIETEAEFLDELLVIFVNKVISLGALENVLFFEFRGKLEEGKMYKLKGEVGGVSFDPKKYSYGVEVKGATFTMAKFEKKDDIYEAQCVVDV